MDWDEYSKWGATISNWGAQYHKNLRDLPVRAQVEPGEVMANFGKSPPEEVGLMQEVMDDFEKYIMPGVTHWQHPRFFAYFPSNASPPSILADFLTATLSAQCMLWQTSPAATELEICMLDWLRQSVGLPKEFQGVIQDSASSATLAAVLTMRERKLGWQGNIEGLNNQKPIRIYTSADAHSSIEKAVWISGIGQKNLKKLPVNGKLRSIDAKTLKKAIEKDKNKGYLPAGLICVSGATGAGSCDDLSSLIKVAQEHNLYVHVDAAWAGSAMICDEYRYLWDGVQHADSVVFNPHKWLGVQFDCSAHFLRSPSELVRTLAISPEYLKTPGKTDVINFSEWSIPLGRRFRALKLWFLLRVYGLKVLRSKIRNHVKWSEVIAEKLEKTKNFEIVTTPILSLFTFRYLPEDSSRINEFNEKLVELINKDGRIYLTQSLIEGKKVIRFQVGQFATFKEDVDEAYVVICELAEKLSIKF